MLKDHIGSINMVLDDSGQVIVPLMHFGAFGARQSVINWQDPLLGDVFSAENQISTRGFTGHEMVDSVGIIHMNGRIYDPQLGRFLQADPFVQAPKNSQSLNRYSYVFNNPLSNTDPTGYFSLSGFVKQYWRAAASILISVYLPVKLPETWSAITKGAVTGFVAGGVATGTFNGALVGAFTGQAFGALHGFAPVSTGGRLVKVAAHGIVGGAGSSLSGGKFGHGFVAAGFTQAVGQFGGDDFFANSGSTSDRLNNVIKAAMIGGTASAISGGKFANGAVTGAFSRALNDEQVSRKDDRKFRVKLSARIRNWLEIGANSEGFGFAKFGGNGISLYVDGNGNLRLEGGGSKYAARITDKDMDFLADRVGGLANFKGLQVRLSVNEVGDIMWAGAVRIPGILSRFGINGRIEVSSSFSPSETLRNTYTGQLFIRYSRGTMQNCAIANPEAC